MLIIVFHKMDVGIQQRNIPSHKAIILVHESQNSKAGVRKSASKRVVQHAIVLPTMEKRFRVLM